MMSMKREKLSSIVEALRTILKNLVNKFGDWKSWEKL